MGLPRCVRTPLCKLQSLLEASCSSSRPFMFAFRAYWKPCRQAYDVSGTLDKTVCRAKPSTPSRLRFTERLNLQWLSFWRCRVGVQRATFEKCVWLSSCRGSGNNALWATRIVRNLQILKTRVLEEFKCSVVLAYFSWVLTTLRSNSSGRVSWRNGQNALTNSRHVRSTVRRATKWFVIDGEKPSDGQTSKSRLRIAWNCTFRQSCWQQIAAKTANTALQENKTAKCLAKKRYTQDARGTLIFQQ